MTEQNYSHLRHGQCEVQYSWYIAYHKCFKIPLIKPQLRPWQSTHFQPSCNIQLTNTNPSCPSNGRGAFEGFSWHFLCLLSLLLLSITVFFCLFFFQHSAVTLACDFFQGTLSKSLTYPCHAHMVWQIPRRATVCFSHVFFIKIMSRFTLPVSQTHSQALHSATTSPRHTCSNIQPWKSQTQKHTRARSKDCTDCTIPPRNHSIWHPFPHNVILTPIESWHTAKLMHTFKYRWPLKWRRGIIKPLNALEDLLLVE